MKRIILLSLFLILSVSFVGCGKKIHSAESPFLPPNKEPSESLRSEEALIEPTLMESIKNQDEAAALKLIEEGSNINEKDNDLETPLLLSIQYGLDNVAETLIHRGVNLKARNSRGDSALYLAWFYHRPSVLKLLLEKTDLPLLEAVEAGRVEFAFMLIDKRADLNRVDDSGNTALMVALKKGSDEMARKLLESGANFEMKNIEGDTALHLSAKKFDIEMTRLLLRSGANHREKNRAGKNFKKIWKDQIGRCKDPLKRQQAREVLKLI